MLKTGSLLKVLAFALLTATAARAQNAINVNISYDASGAATKTISPPSGSVTYCAADIYDSGTKWNNVYKVATFNSNSTGVTNIYQITTNLALVDSQGAASGATLNAYINIFDLDSNATRVEPNNTAGATTTLGPAGLMNQTWRIYRGGNSTTFVITGLTANKEYDLYVYGSTTATNQGCKFTLAAANVPGSNTNSVETIGGNNGEVFDASFVPITPGITWGVLHAVADATGKLAFNTSKNSQNGQYLNGFQLQPICSTVPTISAQPTNVTSSVGSSASFSVTATGDGLTYQWRKNGVALVNNAHISGATTSNLTINPIAIGDIALNPGYDCLVGNSSGCSALSQAGKLYLYSPTMNATPLWPTNGASGVCVDTILKITFNQTPTLNNAGLIRIFDASNPGTPVDQIDLSQNSSGAQSRNIGGNPFNAYPVMITGNTATIFPNLDKLTTNKTYYVTLDPGTFSDGTGALYFGLTNPASWTFTTKATGPANPTNLVVAADGSGDFCTVQGALSYIPSANTQPTVVFVRKGYYQEIVNVNGKNNITFRGEDRQQTLVAYPNNNSLNPGAPWRASFVINGNDCSVETITITNSTPKGGGQAEAIDVEGTRFIGYNMNLASFQDTFLTHNSGKLIYFRDSLIQGDTDFMWGYGTVFVTNCEIRCLTSGGHVTQPRSPVGQNGFSFVNCKVTKGFGSGTFDLGRSISTPLTPSQVIFSTCLMDDAVTGYSSDAGTNFWAHSNSNLTATVAKSSLANATELPASSEIVTNARSALLWLYGWEPKLAPNILTQPTNRTVNAGQTTVFTVSATGVPDPVYQWRKNGTNLVGQTIATFTLANAQPANAGDYSCLVSNAGGSVVSSNAVLSVNPPAQPTMSSPGYSGGQFSFSVGGDAGPDYIVKVSTNLVDWDTFFTTNAATPPFTVTDTDASSFVARFYKIVLGP